MKFWVVLEMFKFMVGFQVWQEKNYTYITLEDTLLQVRGMEFGVRDRFNAI